MAKQKTVKKAKGLTQISKQKVPKEERIRPHHPEAPGDNTENTADAPVVKDEARDSRGKKTLTIGETKLGVTIVLNKDECATLGIPETTMTREAIRQIRDKLGLSAKAGKGAS